MNCDPNALIENAKCFDCLSPASLIEVKSYLICAWLETIPVIDSFRIVDTGDFRSTDTGDLRIVA